MRKPVKDPGPMATAMPSTPAVGSQPASAMTRSKAGIRRSAWVVRCTLRVYSPTRRSPSRSATPPVAVDVSSPMIRMGPVSLPCRPHGRHQLPGRRPAGHEGDAAPGRIVVHRFQADLQVVRGQGSPYPVAPLHHAYARGGKVLLRAQFGKLPGILQPVRVEMVQGRVTRVLVDKGKGRARDGPAVNAQTLGQAAGKGGFARAQGSRQGDGGPGRDEPAQ